MEFLFNLGYCFLVFFAKIAEISIQSVKTVLMVKGQKTQAAILAFIECMIWGIVISSIIHTLSDNYLMLIFYGLGYSAGLYIGSIIENKIALGTSSIQIMVTNDKLEMVEKYLNENNRGYTVLNGRGSKVPMNFLVIILPRKDMKTVMNDIRSICNKDVFVISSEVSKFVGGYGIKK